MESGIKYVKRNFWPGVRFVDLADLNRQAAQWCSTVADLRVHGTTHERPADRLRIERECLQPLPGPERLEVFLREERQVGRDGYVQWENAWYGLPWPWKPGQVVQVQPRDGIVELWDGDKRLAVHARATQRGQRFTHPRQWAGLKAGDGRPSKEVLAVQLPTVEVERRPLAAYEALVGTVQAR